MPENSIGVPSPEEVETPVLVDGEAVHLNATSIVLEADEMDAAQQSENPLVEDYEDQGENPIQEQHTDS